MSWSRRAFLAGSVGGLTGALLRPRAFAGASGDLDLIVVTALGGWDVSYVLDPKPGSALVDGPELDEAAGNPDDRETLQRFGDIDLWTNAAKRPAVTTFFERWHDRAVVVRGLWVGSLSHDECRVRLLTGTTTETRPDLAAMAGAGLGLDAPIPYMDLGGAGYTGELAALSGRTGASNQLRQLLDRQVRVRGPTGAGFDYPLYVPQQDDQAAIAAWLDARASAFEARWAGAPGAAERLDDRRVAVERARRLRDEGRSFAQQLPFGTVANLRGQVDVALELLGTGLSRTVLLDSGRNWDTHDDSADQHALYEGFFADLDHLVTSLDAAGRLSRTLVVVLSEMTRTPRRNEAGGKDHWPITSAMVLGGPVLGGRVLGASTDGLDAAPIDIRSGLPSRSGTVLRYDQFAAGVLTTLDVDPARWFGATEALGGFTA